jgi:endoglucanase
LPTEFSIEKSQRQSHRVIINWRNFLMSAPIAAGLLTGSSFAQPEPVSSRPQPTIPGWRGFNLTELAGGQRRQRHQETDFKWMAEWGFNFARLPCSYWAWSDKNRWMTIEERLAAARSRHRIGSAVWNSH